MFTQRLVSERGDSDHFGFHSYVLRLQWHCAEAGMNAIKDLFCAHASRSFCELAASPATNAVSVITLSFATFVLFVIVVPTPNLKVC